MAMIQVEAKKQEIIEQYRQHKNDTGSVEVQIALLSERINHLTGHFKSHPKDTNSRRGLLKMVGKRSAFLKYLARHNPRKYQDVIKKLGIRK